MNASGAAVTIKEDAMVADTTEATSDTPSEPQKQLSQRRQRFGSVRVAWHRMTLGENPGGSKNGPPVMLSWDSERKDRFESVDKFSERLHGDGAANDRQKPIYRMSKFVRRDIALQNHTEDEIAEVEKEVILIRQGRKDSSRELDEGSIKGIIQQKKKQADQTKEKKKSGMFGFLKRKPRS